MHLISTYLRPSATSHAIKCRLGEELLVVSRINRLDAYELLADGVRLLTSLELLPRVVALHEITPDEGPGALLVITDHPDCSALIVEFSTKERTLSVRSSRKLISPYGLPLTGCISCAISSDGSQAAVALYQGIMNILSFSRKKGGVVISSKSECSIRELILSSFCFVSYTNDISALALLHHDHKGDGRLTIRNIITADEDGDRIKEISSDAVDIPIKDRDFNGLVSIPSLEGGAGGVLLYGGQNLEYYEIKDTEDKREPQKRRKSSTPERGPDLTVEWTYSAISGFGFIDQDRLLISDQYGKLVLVSLGRSDKHRVKQLSLHLLGDYSSARCIAYLNAGVVFLGSENGDSYLARINPTGEISILDTFQSVAPITDAVFADLDNSGEPVVVTCSGGGRTGSLRVIRTGANVEEVGFVTGVNSIVDIFPLSDGDGHHSYLLVSFQHESRLIDARGLDTFLEIPENEFPGMIRNQNTIAAANISGRKGDSATIAVQITSAAAILFDVQSGMEYQRWNGPITVATITGALVCLGLRGGRAVTLTVEVDRPAFITRGTAQFDQELSAVSIYHSEPQLVFIGFWEEHVVGTYNFDTLRPVTGVDNIEMPHVPRSIMAWSFGSGAQQQVYLLVGTGNGQLVSLRLFGKRHTIDMSSRYSTSLGDRPVRLYHCRVDGTKVAMAVGSRTVILSSNSQRIAHHHVGIKGILGVAEFNTRVFSECLLFNLSSGLSIARIGRLEKLKIDTISLGYDVPVALAYHQDANAFAVGCVRTEPSRTGAPDIISSSFKLIDALTLEHLNSFSFGAQEEAVKVITASLDINGDFHEYVAVGTAIWEEDGTEPSKGRILLFRTQTRRPRGAAANPPMPEVLLSLDEQLPGSVVSMAVLDGKLAVIVNTILIVYAVQKNDVTDDLELRQVDQWVHSYALWNIVVDTPNVILGDSLQSVTLLTWDNAEKKLKYVAQDWTSLNSMNVTADEEVIIQSDIDGNLASFDIESTGDKLDRLGHYFFSETISHLMPGSVRTAGEREEPLLIPKHLLFTPGGRISVISKCDDRRAMLLHQVHRNIGAALKEDHYDVLGWRAPRTKSKLIDEPSQSSGFLDGDLLARFLELDAASPKMKTILDGTKRAEALELDHAQLRELIEELQIIH